jgi:hypothetical protein
MGYDNGSKWKNGKQYKRNDLPMFVPVALFLYLA